MAFEAPSGEVNFLAIKEQGTQISVLTKNLTTTNTTKILALLITDWASQYNVFTPMTPEQIADLAEEFAVEYWHYTLEDFVCFFQRAKKNLYGKVTNRVDRGVILEMLARYDAERLEAFFQHESNGHNLVEAPIPFKEGPFSFADVIECVKSGKDPEQYIHEKKMKEAGVEVLPDESEKKAEILRLQVEAFVKQILSWDDPRARKFQPFYKIHPEAIEAELKKQRKIIRDAKK